MDGPAVDTDAPERRLHPWSWLFVLLQQLKQFIFPLIALLVFGARKSDDGDPWLAFAPVIGIAVLVVLAILQYFTYRYVIGRDGLTVREGLLHRSRREIPFSRIHNVVVHQSLLHRVFGVAEVRLESAGGQKPEAQMRVLGLRDALAPLRAAGGGSNQAGTRRRRLPPWAGEAAAGFWGLALRYLKAPATLVGSAVSQALYPRLAAAAADEAPRLVRQVMALLAVPALGLMALLLVAGPWLFERLFGAPWREAGELARALAPYIAAHFVAAPLAVVTMAWDAQRWAFRLALVGQALFVAALAIGLMQGGLIGGAWAVSAVMVPYFGWYFWRLARWPQVPARQVGA